MPEAVIRKIFEEFLSLQEKAYFLQVCSFFKIQLQQLLWNPYLLPVEAFGNRAMCENILPMPKELLDILDGEDGNLYVCVLKASRFQRVINGKHEVFPATYEEIEKASKLRGGLGYSYISDSIISQEDSCELREMQWILMTKDVLLNSRWRTYDSQVTLVQNWISENLSLREGFEIPKDPRDVVYVLFYQFCQDQARLYSDHPWTFMRCQKLIDEYRVTLGGFVPAGLDVIRDQGDPDGHIGVGVLRKF